MVWMFSSVSVELTGMIQWKYSDFGFAPLTEFAHDARRSGNGFFIEEAKRHVLLSSSAKFRKSSKGIP
jgi:hypothetical protein